MDEQQNSDQHSTPLRISRNLRDRSSRINYANLTVPDKRARRSRSPSPARRNLLTVNISPVSTPNIPERITEESRSYDSNNNQKNGDTGKVINSSLMALNSSRVGQNQLVRAENSFQPITNTSAHTFTGPTL